MSISMKIKDLPRRPIRSKNLSHVGSKIVLVVNDIQSKTSNHFVIDLPKDLDRVHIFHLSIFDDDNVQVEDNARFLISNLIKSVQGRLKELFQRYYQSGMNMWTTNEILVDDCTISTSRNERGYVIRMKHVRCSSLNDLIRNHEHKMELEQILNVVVKNYLHRKGYRDVDVNQRYYKSSELVKADATVQQPNGVSLQILEGYFTTVQIIGGQPYLMVDYVSRVLRNETLYDLMRIIKGQDAIRQALKGICVMAKYGNHRMYTVVDVDFSKTPSSITDHDPSLTYIQYYKNAYDLDIRDKGQPMIIGRAKKAGPVLLIPEILRTTGLTDGERSNGKLMVDVSGTTKKDPTCRNTIIMNCARDLRSDFQGDGYKIWPLKCLEALQLKPPAIRTTKWDVVDEKRNIVITRVLKPSLMQGGSWLVIYRSTCDDDEDDIDTIIGEIRKASSNLGSKFGDPFLIGLKTYNVKTWIDELSKEIDIGRPILVVSAVPDKFGGLYQSLKQYLLQKEGIPHQNLQPLKFLNSKNKQALALKIAQQINVKLGCPLWQVELPPGITQRTILIGLDVYHKTMVGRRSIAGFVASMDPTFTQYWSASIILGKGQELTHNISGYMREALLLYRARNGFLPDTIIFYRDGVGESQINAVIEIETKQIVNIFQTVAENYNPAFAEILIKKRIRHRFFLKHPTDATKVTNPQSGTIVANKVVEEGYSFKMVAQNVNSGTATPTHYQLIYNSTELKEETFWLLTYWQCFNYANWQGSVRVPAVVQYAHKLAYMVGESVQEAIEGDIQHKLYYL